VGSQEISCSCTHKGEVVKTMNTNVSLGFLTASRKALQLEDTTKFLNKKCPFRELFVLGRPCIHTYSEEFVYALGFMSRVQKFARLENKQSARRQGSRGILSSSKKLGVLDKSLKAKLE